MPDEIGCFVNGKLFLRRAVGINGVIQQVEKLHPIGKTGQVVAEINQNNGLIGAFCIFLQTPDLLIRIPNPLEILRQQVCLRFVQLDIAGEVLLQCAVFFLIRSMVLNCYRKGKQRRIRLLDVRIQGFDDFIHGCRFVHIAAVALRRKVEGIL